MKTTGMLLTLSIFIMPIGLSQPAAAESGTDPNFTVELPCTENNWGWFGQDCNDETITIPNGRPIYALLVSGFHQNKNLDMFHYYNFAKYLQERGAYVHYAWWNNLLAPYMEKPLHNDDSVPSYEAVPTHDALVGFWYGFPGCDDCYPNKALPAEDYQFQKDANSLLTAIRQHNPDAAIILVGHSMGGDAVARLADSMPADFDIDLLAPIDPVGNRTCLPMFEWGGGYWCKGGDTFKRFYAVREDWFTLPDKRVLGSNIKYLYHRWQNEFVPPFDFLFNEHFTIHEDSTSVQLPLGTNDESGYDVPIVLGNFGGGVDGHGEIVGFRGALIGDTFDNFAEWLVYILADLTRMFSFESYPLALEAEGDWPKWLPGEPNGGPYAQERIDHLKMWEKDPHYLYKKGFEPWNPGLCMVSREMCNILDTIIGPPDTPVNQPPVADAGADQTVPVGPDCSVAVTLDGSGSYDEDGDNITYSWRMACEQIAIGVNPTIQLPYEDVYTIELVVNDEQESSLPDQVVITAVDTTAPVLTCPADVVLECPADTSVEANGSATAIDNCDDSVVITYEDEIILGVGNNMTVIRTWTTTDAAGNSSSCEQVIIVEDTTPPEFSLTVTPDVLWPANHKMVEITPSWEVSDNCDEWPEVTLVSISSNEDDDSKGDGHTSDDVQGADFGTDDRAFSLRAERTGKDLGRIYTVNYRAMDASGNVADATAEVTVLHDSGK